MGTMNTDDFWSHNMPPSIDDTNALARYNAERARGIMHHPAWVVRMEQLQKYFDSNIAIPTFQIQPHKRRRWFGKS